MALFAQGPPIYGGTDQVQRNIIGERVLGLPKEPGRQGDPVQGPAQERLSGATARLSRQIDTRRVSDLVQSGVDL